MTQGKPKKEFHQYLCDARVVKVSNMNYLLSPASTFLKYTVEAKDAIDLCVRKFPKIKNNRDFSTDSLDSIQHLTTAILPSIMGHFETYQRSLFAGMFDYSVYLKDFDIKAFVKKLNDGKIDIDITRLSAYRTFGANSIGNIIADTLTGWHDPEIVNKHFGAFKLNYTFYSKETSARLKVLWQLRHSIVHTGGTLTLPDAQKVDELRPFGNKQIAFEKNFIYEVSRKLHPIIKSSTTGIGNAFKQNLTPNIAPNIQSKIDKFFEVKSSISVWL